VIIRIVDGSTIGEIPGPGGRLVSYRLQPASPGNALWALTLSRGDTGQTYRVERQRAGVWQCSCPAWQYAKGEPRQCKHTRFARDLWILLLTFRTEDRG
jgi:hypothetical protein